MLHELHTQLFTLEKLGLRAQEEKLRFLRSSWWFRITWHGHSWCVSNDFIVLSLIYCDHVPFTYDLSNKTRLSMHGALLIGSHCCPTPWVSHGWNQIWCSFNCNNRNLLVESLNWSRSHVDIEGSSSAVILAVSSSSTAENHRALKNIPDTELMWTHLTV